MLSLASACGGGRGQLPVCLTTATQRPRAKALRPPRLAITPPQRIATLLAGLPQDGKALGNPHAPVTVQFFGDLQCPYCRRFTLEKLAMLIRRYVRTGKLKIEYRSLRTATHDPETFRIQQVAALAAGRQNKLWNFIELFYREQRDEKAGMSMKRSGRLAASPGLGLFAWNAHAATRNLPRISFACAMPANITWRSRLVSVIHHEHKGTDEAAIAGLAELETHAAPRSQNAAAGRAADSQKPCNEAMGDPDSNQGPLPYQRSALTG